MTDDRHTQLSRRAYELWEQGGGEHGRHEEHWHQANLELEGGSGEKPQSDAASDAPSYVPATADELNGLPRGEVPAADGTTMTEPAAVQPGRNRAAKPASAKPATSAASKPRKPKAK